MNDFSIHFRPISVDDFTEVLKWSRDQAFCLANDWELDRDREELYDWWLRCVKLNETNFKRIGIECNSRLIGYADLANINETSAEIGIAIGESTLWGKGIGTYALQHFINYASNLFYISTFHAETHETNLRSRKMLEKVGFKEISSVGTELYNGEVTQLIQYQLLKD
ncbi:GNAT family N-acetyltransferase [Ornithinibacillus halotolerans]|uniref:Acetyltransferase ribosomal protein N-acetylase n=1 Tax=Ornithinibacillus halotolerans TaxID=1274357 RepID=A0A916W6G2_9BACI|nr:GNAT family N-acetyltransferase [Ornithinibacillus halotolerans]GGA70095.1 acetyltransferase ribosomal protein N-acetylase [Ornithinibacillus halotolerans]